MYYTNKKNEEKNNKNKFHQYYTAKENDYDSNDKYAKFNNLNFSKHQISYKYSEPSFYNDEYFRKQFENFMRNGINLKKIKSSSFFISGMNPLKNYNLRLYIPEKISNYNSTIFIDNLFKNELNYKIIEEFQIILTKNFETNNDFNLKTEEKKIIKLNYMNRKDPSKNKKIIKISDFFTILFGSFTSNFLVYLNSLNDENILKKNSIKNSTLSNTKNFYKKQTSDQIVIFPWKCISFISKNNKTYDFISDEDDDIFSLYLIMNILIIAINKQYNFTSVNEEAINTSKFVENLQTPKNKKLKIPKSGKYRSERGLSSINFKSNNISNINNNKPNTDLSINNSLQFDKNSITNNILQYSTRHKSSIRNFNDRKSAISSDIKARSKSKSNIMLSNLAKTKNDTSMKNLDVTNFNLNGEINHGENLDDNKNKNNFNLYDIIINNKERLINKRDKNQREIEDNFKNFKITKIMQKLINIFLWNRTYLKIKSNFNNVKDFIMDDEIEIY